MCVAIPARITWIGEATPVSIPGLVDVAGRSYQVDLAMVPGAVIGDKVITHSGYAIRLLTNHEAERTFTLMEIGDDVTARS